MLCIRAMGNLSFALASSSPLLFAGMDCHAQFAGNPP
jgi:hypothetical protein